MHDAPPWQLAPTVGGAGGQGPLDPPALPPPVPVPPPVALEEPPVPLDEPPAAEVPPLPPALVDDVGLVVEPPQAASATVRTAIRNERDVVCISER